MHFPVEVRHEIGYALYLAQNGELHESVKILKGYGSGIYEIVSNYDTNTYRVVYAVKFYNTVYVLHVFQKKSKKGIKTPKEELIVIKGRLKQLKTAFKNGK